MKDFLVTTAPTLNYDIPKHRISCNTYFINFRLHKTSFISLTVFWIGDIYITLINADAV